MSKMNNDSIVIIDGCRTAVGKMGGSLKDFEASDLGGIVIQELVKRTGIEPEIVDEVVFGNVGQAAENAFVARLCGVKGGLPYETTALTVNRLCSSGVQAIVTAAQEIKDGYCEIAIAGGCESMTNLPFYLRNARYGYRMGHAELEDGLITALSDPFSRSHMGVTAENVAERYGITRERQDEVAFTSQQRATKAINAGKFKDEIVPIEIKLDRKGLNTAMFSEDEHVRPNVTLEGLAKMRPAFKENGTVTAGNASGINDGAAAVLLMKESKAKELGLTPKMRLIDSAVAGVDPMYMGIGPVPAMNKLFLKTGLNKSDIDVFELNEAFAAQAAACIQELDLDEEKVNLNGSGIAMGHPIGATGAILTVKLMNELIRQKAKYGIVSLCIGGGQGIAVLFENLVR